MERTLAVEQAGRQANRGYIMRRSASNRRPGDHEEADRRGGRAEQGLPSLKRNANVLPRAEVLTAKPNADRPSKGHHRAGEQQADREAKKLIAAQRVISENKIHEETAADVSAYIAVKKAEPTPGGRGNLPGETAAGRRRFHRGQQARMATRASDGRRQRRANAWASNLGAWKSNAKAWRPKRVEDAAEVRA
jgi:hypothetical protein